MPKTPKAVQRALAERRALTPEEGKKLFAPKAPSETAEQIQLMTWVRQNEGIYPEFQYLTAIPNAEQSKAQAKKKWAEGVRAGYPDLLWDVARGGWFGLRLEGKRSGDWNAAEGKPYARGEPRPNQVAWHRWLRTQRLCVVIYWDIESAKDVLRWYHGLEPTLNYLVRHSVAGHATPIEVPPFARTRSV